MKKLLSVCVYGNAAVVLFLALYLFIVPAVILIRDLHDPGLRTGQIPRFAFRWHRALSEKYESWARARVGSGKAAEMSVNDISGTEWPVFGSVFYLWATEALQEAWEKDNTLAPRMPKEYARGAVKAAADLVLDPNHAGWVKQHWGDDYLVHEDLFYRMLLISGLASYQKLSGDDTNQAFLRAQVESLSRELETSPYGLLDDYPGECYPIDIVAAIDAVRRSDEVLGADHSGFVARAVRAFEGGRLDENTGLPAYRADSRTGEGIGSARGIGMSFILTWAPNLWPETARKWYAGYEKQFWQSGRLLVGFREFPQGRSPSEWCMDVDSGPVVAGYGTTASAFGIGAARVNGRFDQAYPLSAEALVVSWPLLDGTRVGARLLSNLSDAPYIGEAALLFVLTRRPLKDSSAVETGKLPMAVYLVIALFLGFGLILAGIALRMPGRWKKCVENRRIPLPRLQLSIWAGLFLAGLVVALFFNTAVGWILLLAGQFLPRSDEGVRG